MMINSPIYVIYSRILDLINECPFIPEQIKQTGGVMLCETNERKTGMSVLLSVNSSSIKTLVCGEIECIVDIIFYYRGLFVGNEPKLDAINLVSSIGYWLEGAEISYEGEETSILDYYPIQFNSGEIVMMQISEHAHISRRFEDDFFQVEQTVQAITRFVS